MKALGKKMNVAVSGVRGCNPAMKTRTQKDDFQQLKRFNSV